MYKYKINMINLNMIKLYAKLPDFEFVIGLKYCFKNSRSISLKWMLLMWALRVDTVVQRFLHVGHS